MTKEHIHKLKKHKYGNGTAIYFCILNCSFKVDAPLAVGREVLCHLCERPFTMHEKHLKLVRPHCDNCSKKKVTGDDGKKRYIRPGILQEMATDVVSDLSQRLRSEVDEPDKDL